MIVTPIVGLIDSDVNIFESIEDALAYMEPWDVSDGSWKLWDCEGRVLEAATEVADRRPINIRGSESVDIDGLAGALFVFLGSPDSLKGLSASRIVQTFLDQ